MKRFKRTADKTVKKILTKAREASVTELNQRLWHAVGEIIKDKNEAAFFLRSKRRARKDIVENEAKELEDVGP